MVVALLGYAAPPAHAQTLLKPTPKAFVDEVWQIVNRTYGDPAFNQLDWAVVRREYLNRCYRVREQSFQRSTDLERSKP